jgi:hypothetical protein
MYILRISIRLVLNYLLGKCFNLRVLLLFSLIDGFTFIIVGLFGLSSFYLFGYDYILVVMTI